MDRRTYLKSAGAAGAALSVTGCLGGGGGSETITIGSDIPYPPFEMMENGEVTGFDPAIAQAVFTDELGYEHSFKDTSFDGIIQALNNGNFRVIMSAMTITEERAQEVDFSDPYFTAYQTIATLENSDITSKADLAGKTVGVQKGTTGAGAAEQLKSELNGDLTIKRYDTIASAFNALLNNQVAAVINDNTVSAEYVSKNDEDLRFVEGEGAAAEQGREAPPYLTLTVEDYGIAFRKGDELVSEVNDALATIKENGTYDDIYSEYFAG
ncbi:basic amino acid ABC transporter substrate-binding protein [Halobaculum gomorrense]|uniref:Amino acid ABC transporter substrate-binding protein, PAAT family n=1 Tax=Halobaculum gomorrense TaxID=43928 RepID=A0A1M5TM02_9EURY|nr:basic amino acid ABC transporter substrate-binding protein [Halobaculum gomorrense]SHH51696.1 amino acid ABC transporter substrate-binding protein, PAAT family [Halobaculum gomorrense]